MTRTDRPRSRLRSALDWGIFAAGVVSLAFAVLATTTGIGAADTPALFLPGDNCGR
jgi:hypothetical protein